MQFVSPVDQNPLLAYYIKAMTDKKQYWINKFKEARSGHVCWDGNAKIPNNPDLAYESSVRDAQLAQSLGFFKPGNKVLDIGCGNGRLGIALSYADITYIGIDPMLDCVKFCEKAFCDFQNFQFMHLDIKNEHSNPNGKIDPIDLTLPFNDNTFDDILVYSVFTHLNYIEKVARYMMEIKRILKPGGHLVTTWYRSPPNPLNPETGRTTYYEHDIMTVLNGFHFLHTYGGHTDSFYDQWVIFSKYHDQSS